MFLVMYPFTRHIVVDLLDLSHVLVSNSATAVAHEHIAVDKSDGAMGESVCATLHKTEQQITHWFI